MSIKTFCKPVVSATLLLALATAQTATASLVISASSTAPTIGTDDIANLGTPTGSQLIWSDRPVLGQSFTSGSTTSDLLAITIQLYEDPSKAPLNGWKDYQLRFGTMDMVNNVINPSLVTVNRYLPDANSDDYFTFTFDTAISLAPNTLYGFDIGIEKSQDGWQSGIPAIRTTNDNYAGGQRFQGAKTNQIDNTTGMPNDVSSSSGDLVFHLDISSSASSSVPEPGSLVLFGFAGSMLMVRRRRQQAARQ